MKSHELMRLLIPDSEVKETAEFTGLTPSLLYQERREAGKDLTHTGTRNTIDRLDLFCERVLDKNPDVVRLLGERYTGMYRRHTCPIEGPVTVSDVIRQLGIIGRECGEATAALSGAGSIKDCEVEVAQAKRALERGLEMVIAMEVNNA
jgi:hypothetical protein